MKIYKGWLVSTDLSKRSLAVVGHYLIGMLIVSMVVFVIGLIFSVLSFIFSS